MEELGRPLVVKRRYLGGRRHGRRARAGDAEAKVRAPLGSRRLGGNKGRKKSGDITSPRRSGSGSKGRSLCLPIRRFVRSLCCAVFSFMCRLRPFQLVYCRVVEPFHLPLAAHHVYRLYITSSSRPTEHFTYIGSTAKCSIDWSIVITVFRQAFRAGCFEKRVR